MTEAADEKVDGTATSTVPGERIIDKPELPKAGVYTDATVRVEMVEGSMQLKRGVAEEFEVFCDEAERIGGNSTYPTPMHYVALGTGF
jgi:hypothetical protein